MVEDRPATVKYERKTEQEGRLDGEYSEEKTGERQEQGVGVELEIQEVVTVYLAGSH